MRWQWIDNSFKDAWNNTDVSKVILKHLLDFPRKFVLFSLLWKNFADHFNSLAQPKKYIIGHLHKILYDAYTTFIFCNVFGHNSYHYRSWLNFIFSIQLMWFAFGQQLIKFKLCIGQYPMSDNSFNQTMVYIFHIWCKLDIRNSTYVTSKPQRCKMNEKLIYHF